MSKAVKQLVKELRREMKERIELEHKLERERASQLIKSIADHDRSFMQRYMQDKERPSDG